MGYILAGLLLIAAVGRLTHTLSLSLIAGFGLAVCLVYWLGEITGVWDGLRHP